MPLKPRDMVVDNWDREGIVVEQRKRPGAAWLADQTDARMREVPDGTPSWLVLNIRGGAIIVPEPLARFVSEATIEDAMRAVEYANEHALRTLGQLFPELVELALQRRQKGVHEA